MNLNDTERKPRSLNEAALKEIIGGKRTGITIREAITELGRKYGKTQPAFFYSLFKKKNLSPDSRVRALEQYLLHTSTSAETILLKHLADEDSFVQRQVVAMLGKTGEMKALKQLLSINTRNERLKNGITLAAAKIGARLAVTGGVLKKRLRKPAITLPDEATSELVFTRMGKNDEAAVAACLKTEGLQKKMDAHLPLLCGRHRYMFSYNTAQLSPAPGISLCGTLLLYGDCPEGYQLQAYVFREEGNLYFITRGGQLLYMATVVQDELLRFELHSTQNSLFPNQAAYVSGTIKKGKPVFERAVSGLVKTANRKKAKTPVLAVNKQA